MNPTDLLLAQRYADAVVRSATPGAPTVPPRRPRVRCWLARRVRRAGLTLVRASRCLEPASSRLAADRWALEVKPT